MSDEKTSKDRFEEAREKVFAELEAMSPEEFRAAIDKHANGEFAQLLKDAGALYKAPAPTQTAYELELSNAGAEYDRSRGGSTGKTSYEAFIAGARWQAKQAAPTGLQEADMSGFVSTREKAIDLKGDVKCVTTTPLETPAVTAKPDREHRIAMGEGYSAAYVEARKHMWPEAHIRHAVSKAYRDGYMQAHIDRDAESAEAIRPDNSKGDK